MRSAISASRASAVATILYSIVLVLADNLLGRYVPSPAVVVELAVAAAVYNAALMPFAFAVLRRFQSRPQATQ